MRRFGRQHGDIQLDGHRFQGNPIHRCTGLFHPFDDLGINKRHRALADADEIYLSEHIYEAEGVRTLLEPLKVESKISKLKGIQQDLRLFYIAADLSSGRPAAST